MINKFHLKDQLQANDSNCLKYSVKRILKAKFIKHNFPSIRVVDVHRKHYYDSFLTCDQITHKVNDFEQVI